MNNAQLRIYELSKELNLENKELLAICDKLNIVVRSHSSRISESEAEQIRLAAEKLASKKETPKNELGITSHQPKSPEIISQNRLAPLLKQQILKIPKPIIVTNRPSNIRIWEVFLQIEEKIAKGRQFCVSFLTHNGFGRQVTFGIDVTSATLEGSDENSLTVENFWERVKLAKNEEIKLSETTPTRENWHSNRNKLGTIEKVVPNSCTISVTLKDDLADNMAAGRYQLPATGFLFFEAVGDIQQIKRKKEALAQLKQGRTQNPYLGNFLFDASQARPILKTVELRPEDLLLSSANPSQKAAVEMVLAAEDLVVIQGPPGTGKTTVIAEICYQVALRGGRTLITSQANLAVDNVLSRLVHNPVIRAVRKGKAEKVGVQGQPFLEDRVIGTWLENTATYCEKNITQRLDNVRVLPQFLAASQRFTTYLKVEEVFKGEQNLLQTRKANLESACTTQKKEYNQAASQLGEVESLKTALEELLNQAPSVDWQDPALLNLWAGLNKYTSTDASLRNFAVNLQLAIDLASELGIVHPNYGLFGLARWLHKTVASWITEVRTALAYASDIAMVMTEADLTAQTYTQNSEFLARLKSNHQQLLANQQSLHQRIRNLHNRESEVSLAINDLDIWLSTANLDIVNVLKQCLQNRQGFTVDLISLPSGLQSMTIADQYLPWQQSLDRCRVKVNKLIQKYHEWDRVWSQIIEINNLLVRGRNLLGNHSINKAAISQVSFSKALDPMESLINLKQLAQHSIDNIEKPLGVWGRIIEWVLAIALKQKSLDFIAQKLRPYSRRYGAAITLKAIKRQAQIIRQRVQPVESELVLSQITAEVVNGIVTSARTWLKQLQTETEKEQKQLEVQLNEQMRLAVNEQQKISANQEQLETSCSEADLKLKRAIALLQELFPFPYLPKELRLLVQQYLDNPSNILTETPRFTAKIRHWGNCTKQLNTLISLIDPFATLSASKDLLIVRITSLHKITETYKKQFIETQSQIQKIVENLRQQLNYISTERTWWQSIWEDIPSKFKPKVDSTDLFNIDFLHTINTQFKSWQQQLQKDEIYLNRYQNFVQDWIGKLRKPTEGDRTDLRQIYLNNANVIGITCVQAANYDFSK